MTATQAYWLAILACVTAGPIGVVLALVAVL